VPRNRKYIPHKSVLFITTRIEEGLPLVPNDLINLCLWGILARARTMYDVQVCHFIFMNNHLHLILVVSNPDHVKNFIGYIKTESSHLVNRLLGRRQRTIWQRGYDSPLLLTPEKVEHYIRYLYLNPARANLEASIALYPGVSSWQMFTNDISKTKHRKIQRSDIKPLQNPALSIKEQQRLTEQYLELDSIQYTFTLEPWAWLSCFPKLMEDTAQIKARLLSDIRAEERKLEITRLNANRSVIGATALRRQNMLAEYIPTKFSPRTICICDDKEMRKRFLQHFRALCDAAVAVYARWKVGDFSWQLPPGMFAPRVPTLCSALPV
jgi:REP element-mobilizing transposase RayT